MYDPCSLKLANGPLCIHDNIQIYNLFPMLLVVCRIRQAVKVPSLFYGTTVSEYAMEPVT